MSCRLWLYRRDEEGDGEGEGEGEGEKWETKGNMEEVEGGK